MAKSVRALRSTSCDIQIPAPTADARPTTSVSQGNQRIRRSRSVAKKLPTPLRPCPTGGVSSTLGKERAELAAALGCEDSGRSRFIEIQYVASLCYLSKRHDRDGGTHGYRRASGQALLKRRRLRGW